MSKEKPVGTHNPRASSVNHAMWLLLVAGLTIELSLESGSASLWFSAAWCAVGIALFPAAIYGSCTTLRNVLLLDAMFALTILSYFLLQGFETLFAVGILVGQTAFAVYLAELTNRQILEYKRLEKLHESG